MEEEQNINFRSLNYLLDSPQDFDREQIKNDLEINILPNQLTTFKAFVLNFVNYDTAIGFTYGNNKHPIKAFNPHQITYSTLQGVINKLHQAKLIKFKKGEASHIKKERKKSIAEPTAKFTKWLSKNVWFEEIYTNATSHIRLRDTNKNSLEHRETTYTKHVDSVMKRYHKKLKEWDLAIDGVSLENIHIFVNFTAVKGQTDNKGHYLIRHGGRWWEQWTDMSSKQRLERLSFKKDKGQLMELDYQACGTNALYMWETGKFLDYDPYAQFPYYLYKDTVGIAEMSHSELRNLIKNMVRIGINHGARGLQDAYEKDLGKSFAHDIRRLMGNYRYNHEPIARWMLRGGVVGRRAMFLESNLVLGVLDKLTKANIPSITIYDSFIFPKKYEKQVEKIMYQERSLEWLRKLLAKDEQGQLINS